MGGAWTRICGLALPLPQGEGTPGTGFTGAQHLADMDRKASRPQQRDDRTGAPGQPPVAAGGGGVAVLPPTPPSSPAPTSWVHPDLDRSLSALRRIGAGRRVRPYMRSLR